ncbi:unnamed protein product [Lactuca virosa]|uniref:Uncharacterized protein n=1 Tax=Lactuca virosa TaxID=75947 RepID=A0AAU9NY98_9ASTR|nr:unnamed protein product [Lactuca virosa]
MARSNDDLRRQRRQRRRHCLVQTTTLNTDSAADQESQVPTVVKDNLVAIDGEEDDGEKELHELLLPNVNDLPLSPPSAIEFNFVTYFAPVSGHVAFKDEGGVTYVAFNVGKSNRSEINVIGKRKRNAQHFESNTALCKVCTDNGFFCSLVSGHVAFKDEGGVTYVAFNVGKSNRSEINVIGKRKRNAQHFESNTALCKLLQVYHYKIFGNEFVIEMA